MNSIFCAVSTNHLKNVFAEDDEEYCRWISIWGNLCLVANYNLDNLIIIFLFRVFRCLTLLGILNLNGKE